MIGDSTTMDDSKKSRRQNQIPFKCEICFKEFRSNNGLHYHFNSAHGKKNDHKCDPCGKTFSTVQSLNMHINAVHNGLKDKNVTLVERHFLEPEI